MPENGQGHREAVLTKNQGYVFRVLEEAARWWQQGVESAQWTPNDDIISMLTILNVFAFRLVIWTFTSRSVSRLRTVLFFSLAQSSQLP